MLSSEIIKAPIITEKSTKLSQNNKYTFEVDKRANKTEIKAAVEELFKVTVESVNIINGLKKEAGPIKQEEI